MLLNNNHLIRAQTYTSEYKQTKLLDHAYEWGYFIAFNKDGKYTGGGKA